jgi:KDO2-lipid IV(A) lauroyltransferase
MKKPKISHYIEYYIMLAFQLMIRILPLSIVVYGARILAATISVFRKVRNKIVMDNLKTAFPDMDIPSREKIRNEMYQQILMSMFDSYKYMYLSDEKKSKYIITDEESILSIDKALKNDKGCIVVGGHYGFFEGGAHYGVSINLKSAVVVANQRNKLTEKLIDIPRTKSGFLVIHRKEMRTLIKAIKDNYFIALLSDQNAGSKGVFVPFFGKLAATHQNPAILAIKYSMPILLSVTRRRKDDLLKHDQFFIEVKYDDILEMDIEKDEKILKVVERYTKMIETEIKKDPTQYWWIHKRYKTRPNKD